MFAYTECWWWNVTRTLIRNSHHLVKHVSLCAGVRRVTQNCDLRSLPAPTRVKSVGFACHKVRLTTLEELKSRRGIRTLPCSEGMRMRRRFHTMPDRGNLAYDRCRLERFGL